MTRPSALPVRIAMQYIGAPPPLLSDRPVSCRRNHAESYPEQHRRVAQVPDEKYPENPTKQENAPSKTASRGQLPIEWIIGPYIPAQEQLEALSNECAAMPDLYNRRMPDVGTYIV